MSKPKCWIKTDYLPEDCSFLTKDKWYFDLNGEGYIEDDSGEVIPVNYECSSWLDGEDWQVHYGDTPPDCGILHRTLVTNNALSNLEWVPTILQEPTINNKALGEGELAHQASLPVNEAQDVTGEVLEFLAELHGKIYIYQSHDIEASRMWFDYEELLDKLKSGEYSVIHNTNIN